MQYSEKDKIERWTESNQRKICIYVYILRSRDSMKDDPEKWNKTVYDKVESTKDNYNEKNFTSKIKTQSLKWTYKAMYFAWIQYLEINKIVWKTLQCTKINENRNRRKNWPKDVFWYISGKIKWYKWRCTIKIKGKCVRMALSWNNWKKVFVLQSMSNDWYDPVERGAKNESNHLTKSQNF